MKILIITWAYRLYVKVRRSRHRPGKAGDGQWCQVQRQLQGFLFFKFKFFFSNFEAGNIQTMIYVIYLH